MSKVEQELDPQRVAELADLDLSPGQAYWIRVHALAAELDPLSARYDDEIRKLNTGHRHRVMETSTKEIFITSEKNPSKGLRSGRVFKAGPLLAAKMICDKTHRLSTPEEVKDWHEDQDERVKVAQAIAQAKLPPPPPAPQITVNLPPEALNRARQETRSDAKVSQ